MKINEKKLNMLGLAMRAGQTVSGDELVQAAIRNHTVYLVLCASDASIKTQERFKLKCDRENIPLNMEFTKYEISHAIGKSRTVLGIKNRGMANKFLTYDVEKAGNSKMKR